MRLCKWPPSPTCQGLDQPHHRPHTHQPPQLRSPSQGETATRGSPGPRLCHRLPSTTHLEVKLRQEPQALLSPLGAHPAAVHTAQPPDPIPSSNPPCHMAPSALASRWVTAARGSPGLDRDHPITPGCWQAALQGSWAWAKPRLPRGVSGVGLPFLPPHPDSWPPQGWEGTRLSCSCSLLRDLGGTRERSQNCTCSFAGRGLETSRRALPSRRLWLWCQPQRLPTGPPAGPDSLPSEG